MTKRRQLDTVSITTKVAFRTCRRRRPRRNPQRNQCTRGRGGATLARRLALAHLIERKLEAGELRSYAHAAEILGVTEPRVLQIANLTLLAPDIQQAILDKQVDALESKLRQAAAQPNWKDQRNALRLSNTGA